MKKKIIFSSLISLLLFITSNVKALDYQIDSYDVDIVVNKNNTFDITETIGTYFNTYKHGIIRKIPLKNRLERLDGTVTNNKVRIKNVSVDNEFSKYKENGYYVIKIGSSSETFTGAKKYIIKYNYNIGKDPLKDKDELYFNIIGNEWDTTISDITFKITMPESFDSSKLGFSSGTYGSVTNRVTYNVDGNVITGKYNGTLGVGEALTVRLELPEGYFAGAKNALDTLNYFMLLIPIIFLLISLLIWYKYGKDDKVIETVEFYPPEGLNSLDVGFLYKGQATEKDVTSLIVHLANQGYIKISEFGENTLLYPTKRFKITKLKEYDGKNTVERIFLEGLFEKKQLIFSEGQTNINEVTSTDLYNNFYRTMEKILSIINTKEHKNRIFSKMASNKKILIILMIIATYCLITIPPMIIYGSQDLFIITLLPSIFFTAVFAVLAGANKEMYKSGRVSHYSIWKDIFDIIVGLGLGTIGLLYTLLPIFLQDSIYLVAYLVGLGCIFGMVACLTYLPKRTKYGNEMLGRIRGFKNFLETVEKEKLESMVMQNPTYFYDILPYTYVLGVSDKWIKKFESISLQAPSWYYGYSDFNVLTFGSFMNSMMLSAERVMSSDPSTSSSSSGSSSSGGGFSGGGSGGGGGSSW